MSKIISKTKLTLPSMCFPIKIFTYLIWGFTYHFQQIYTIICFILNIFPWPVSILYKHHLTLMHNISSYNHLISYLTIPWCCHQIFAIFKCHIEHLSWFSWSERRLRVLPSLSDKWQIKSISLLIDPLCPYFNVLTNTVFVTPTHTSISFCPLEQFVLGYGSLTLLN